MKNSVGEEGANSLSSSAPKNGAHIASVKAGISNKQNTTFLPLHISSAREGNSLSRYVNTDDIETQLNKIERISSISAPQSTISTRSDLRRLLFKSASANVLAVGLGENPHNPYPRSSQYCCHVLAILALCDTCGSFEGMTNFVSIGVTS